MSGQFILIIVVLFGLLAIGTLLLAFLMIRFFNRQIKQRAGEENWLRENSTRITAYIMNVTTLDHSTSASVDFFLDNVDGASAAQKSLDLRGSLTPAHYHVVAQGMHPQSHKYYTFERTVTRNELPKNYTPGSDVSFEVGVLIDPKNPRRYYVELPPSS